MTPIQIGRLRSRGIAIAATLPMLVTGCGMIQDQMDPGRVSVSGVKPTVEQINFAGVAAAQDRLIQALQDQAQLSGVTLSYQDPCWSLGDEGGNLESLLAAGTRRLNNGGHGRNSAAGGQGRIGTRPGRGVPVVPSYTLLWAIEGAKPSRMRPTSGM